MNKKISVREGLNKYYKMTDQQTISSMGSCDKVKSS